MSRGHSLSCSGGQPEYGCKRASFVSLWRHSFPQLPSLRLAVVRLSPASASGLQSRRSSVVATPRSCRCCGWLCACGQRALLDADMLELIDRSACLVEPVVVESCAPSVLVLYPQQARPAPRPVAARECPFREALWKVFCSLRAHSELLLSLHCDSCSWMIGTFLCFIMWSTSCSS